MIASVRNQLKLAATLVTLFSAQLGIVGCTSSDSGTPMPIPATMQTPGSPDAGDQIDRMIGAALDQVGDQYVFGAEVSESDPDPDVWDQGEFTQWSAYQVGSQIPGSSFEQYLDLKEKGLLIPIEQGLDTPGALLFHFSEEPALDSGRPSEAHVAISLGDSQTVEAQSPEAGVIIDQAAGRFEYAALLPNVDYPTPAPST